MLDIEGGTKDKTDSVSVGLELRDGRPGFTERQSPKGPRDDLTHSYWKCGLWTRSSASSEKESEMQNLRPYPRPTGHSAQSQESKGIPLPSQL